MCVPPGGGGATTAAGGGVGETSPTSCSLCPSAERRSFLRHTFLRFSHATRATGFRMVLKTRAHPGAPATPPGRTDTVFGAHTCLRVGRRTPTARSIVPFDPSLVARRWIAAASASSPAAASSSPAAASVLEGRLAVFACSDLHVDHPANAAWAAAQQPPPVGAGTETALLLAGDVSDDLGRLRRTLAHLGTCYDHVAFVAGNHELWLRAGADSGGSADSVAKLHAVHEACAELGVHTSPVKVSPACAARCGHQHTQGCQSSARCALQLGGVWVAPVLSWHHKSWDTEPDIPGIPRASAMTISVRAAAPPPRPAPPPHPRSPPPPGCLACALSCGSQWRCRHTTTRPPDGIVPRRTTRRASGRTGWREATSSGLTGSPSGLTQPMSS